MINNTLKEYYVKLTESWNNAISILTTLNQSLLTNNTELNVKISNTDSDGNQKETVYRIPSFLFLENKLETLSNNFEALFNMPDSGEAWLVSDDNLNTFKLEMVKSGTSPISPMISNENYTASITQNNFLKDLVSPKTFLRLEISNLPKNIENVLMKKIIFNDASFYNLMVARNPKSYDEFVTALYTLRKGIDYEEYESKLDLPIKCNKFKSAFRILFVDNEKTYVDETSGNGSNRTFTITLDTLKYTDQEDPSIEFGLKVGDKLSLSNTSTIYIIKEIRNNQNIIVIEEIVGHYSLMSYEENTNMILSIYNNDFDKYHYIDIPLEDNQYIAVMISTVQNNIRSIMSEPKFFNLNEIFITDETGQFIYDEHGNKLSYMQYYEKYCTNIGNIILGLTSSSYPQISALSGYDIEKLQEDENIKKLVSESINSDDILKVLPINSHITNSDAANEIISMHAQKNELSTKISNINDQISNVNNQLSTIDFSQDTSVSQISLKNEITSYNTEKILLQKQLIALVENININSASVDGKELKYRIRGITKPESLEKYIKSLISEKIDIIGIDVEYKYRSINKTTTSVVSIDNAIFSDWNKYNTIDKDRTIRVDSYGNYILEFEDYSETSNIIKWNQIDIPIVSGEDVVIRIRYKYNIGQPFINIYSPWSEEFVMVFPVEYKEKADIVAVLNENKNDIITARLDKTLINDGYTEHIDSGIIDGSKVYYHYAENIYSGFSNNDNNLMSVTDKFNELQKTLEKYQSILDSEVLQKYKVYLTYDDTQIELLPNTTNTVTITNNDHLIDSFVKKKLNINIKNIGDVPVKLYSPFPGGTNVPLILCNSEYYEKTIQNYERVPIITATKREPVAQVLGQWIYFRENNPWTLKSIYYKSSSQDNVDFLANNSLGCVWQSEPVHSLMKKDYSQVLLGCRKRYANPGIFYSNFWTGLSYDDNEQRFVKKTSEQLLDETAELYNAYREKYKNVDEDFFIYKNLNNTYLIRYEDIFYLDNGVKYYLDNETSIFDFVSRHNIGGDFKDDSDFVGAFLYPDIPSLSNIVTDGSVGGYIEIPVGGSVNIPLTLEFFLNKNLISIKKGLNFDIKPSSFQDIIHYSLDIECMYDYTATGNSLSNISLFDESVDV